MSGVSFELYPGRYIGDGYPCLLIAEIGQNHQGDIGTAKRLILAAKTAGADVVKFQRSDLKSRFTEAALNRPYNSPNSWGATYGEHRQRLDLSDFELLELRDYAHEVGLVFTASAMDIDSVDVLYQPPFSVPFLKIGSGDTDNVLMLLHAATKNIPLVVSTGMQDIKAVDRAYHFVKACHKKLVLLHCVSAYPAPAEDLHLQVISMYKERFPRILVGYSGHEIGIDPSVAAVALGAKVIERHLTLDRRQKGSDHICSLTPHEFRKMATRIRQLEVALGTPEKQIRLSEIPCKNKLGKSIVMRRSRPRGHMLNITDIEMKVSEPKGIDPAQLYDIIGSTLIRDVQTDQCLTEDDLYV